MALLKSRKAAAAVMGLLILLSILFGSHRSLTALRGEVEDVFLNGAEGDGFCIQSDLEKQGNIAYNMVTIARHYYEESEPAVRAVLEARDALSGAGSIGEKAKAAKALTQGVTDLHDLLKRTELSEKDEKYPDRLYDEFRSGNDRISRDGYNEKAAEYNGILRQFPANVLGPLTGVKPAELFS